MFRKRNEAKARELAEEAVADEQLRRHVVRALVSAVRLRSRLWGPVGLGVLGTRLAYDRGVQDELRRLAAELDALRGRTRRAQARRRRKRVLTGVGVAGAGVLVARGLARRPRIVESVSVHVPLDTAYNQWTQFEEFPRFMHGIDEVRQLDETHLHWVATIGGRRQEWDAEITEQRPDERIAWRSTSGHDQAGVVTFHRLSDDETRVTVQMEWQPEGLPERLAAATGVARRRVRGDLRRFEQAIESSGRETGAWRGEVKRPDERGVAERA